MSRTTVLVLGGNGFLGSETVNQLIAADTCDIHLLNRNRSWDWGLRDKILPHIKHYFKWDRKKPLQEYKDLTQWLDGIASIDYVIDFSGYESGFVSDSVRTFRNKTKLYIFISTDSIYEVCEKNHDKFTMETDDVIPKDRALRKKFKRKDSYGYNKWKCERILNKVEGMNYVILRLADVIGPCDSTDRWWQYQLWVKAASICDLPLYIPQSLEGKNISLVYVCDVAEVITNIVTNAIEHKQIMNNAFNLAFQETPTLQGLLLKVSSRVQGANNCCKIIFTNNSEVPHIYPSVQKGPIDIAKSKSLLNWDPTPLDEAVEKTVVFYDGLEQQAGYSDSKKDMFEALCEDLSDLYNDVEFAQLKKELHEILSVE